MHYPWMDQNAKARREAGSDVDRHRRRMASSYVWRHVFCDQKTLISVSQNPLELVVVVLAEAGRDEGAGLRGADGLARAGLGENDVPKVGVW